MPYTSSQVNRAGRALRRWVRQEPDVSQEEAGSMTAVMHFLLVFNHHDRVLLRAEQFGPDVDAALRAYALAEEFYRTDPDVEIVLVGSDSLETVQLTHANYFPSTTTSSPYFAGI